MRIAIVGPGALGCLFATLLFPKKQSAEDSLWLLDHNQERANLLTMQGIIYETDKGQERYPISVSSDLQAVGPMDMVLFCVKSQNLDTCLHSCLPLLSPQSLLVFLQNGIGHLDIQERLNLPTAPAFASALKAPPCWPPDMSSMPAGAKHSWDFSRTQQSCTSNN